MDRIKDSRLTLLICLFLAAATLAVYWPVVHNDFVNYDDNCYIVQNRQVQAGVTWKGLAWAFGRLHGDHTYWHPLTWVSHIVDCQLFGLKPAGHHLVNLLFHALNSVVVFLLFKRLTDAFWRSALLAALFALHPLQVDTVAWVAERKNLLSALFFLLTLWAYARYVEVQSPKSKVQGPASHITYPASRFTHDASPPSSPRLWYWTAVVMFACGLMCKPVLVALPFVLLLLDYWPLGRMQNAERRMQNHASRFTFHVSRFTSLRLLAEKVPFLLLSAASCFITIAANRAVGALVEASPALPLEVRVQNALFSYVRYLGKTVWPLNLAVFYPYPNQFPVWRAVAGGTVLLAISGVAIGAARRRPYLLVGWFWFLGVLVPFIGLIQAGEQALADRFAYVPLIGLFLLLVWGTEELTQRWRNRRFLVAATAFAMLVCCASLPHRQTGYWRNSITLFSHALAVTDNNVRARSNLGIALAAEGRTEEAIQQFLEALRLNPEHAIAHGAVGSILAQQGRFDEAIHEYETALRLKPDFPEALNNLAWLKATNPDPQ